MEALGPESPEQLAEILRESVSSGKTICLAGNSTKNRMAGPIRESEVSISTARLNRLRQYEPADLTVSVEAGMPWAELSRILAANRQMIPLDPPFTDGATVGGVLAANTSGPRRRLYGTARDLVIGMTFAMLDGKLIDSGGMVVKNVAGLDMGKLLIGSFGTLAAIATVNFKLWPMPIQRRTFVLKFATMQEAIARRDAILSSALQPAAIDLLNPNGAARISEQAWTLLVEAGGSHSLVERYTRAIPDATVLEGDAQDSLWLRVREFVPSYLAAHPEGTVVRASATLSGLPALLGETEAALIARAGSGVCYACFPSPQAASRWQTNGMRGVIEFAPQSLRADHPEALWPHIDSGFAIMEKVKKMFDPGLLLNRGRLYGRI